MLKAALNRVFRPDGGDLTSDLPLFLGAENLPNLRVVVGPPGIILAHVGFLPREAVVHRRRLRVACVGAVFVAAPFRGQGLATRTLAAVLAAARPSSDLLLVSGEGELYRRAGLEPIPPLWQFQVPTTARAAGIEIREATADDIDSLKSMYNDSDVHFVRSSQDWERLIRAGILMDSPARFSLISRAETPVAYVVAQRARAPSSRDGAGDGGGGGPGRASRILEFAGDGEAIADVASELGETWVVPAYDATTLALIERRGWTGSLRRFPMSACRTHASGDDAEIPWYGLDYL